MLVTFTCKAHADITMFGNDAEHLLELMGHSGTIPSAIFAKDVPAVLERLKIAIESEERTSVESVAIDGDDNDTEIKVSTANRAFPLIQMLIAAIEADCNVMWRKN